MYTPWAQLDSGEQDTPVERYDSESILNRMAGRR